MLTYDIFYRFEQANPDFGPPYTAVLDIPNSAINPSNSSRLQVYFLMELSASQSYEVKVRAVTSVGPGPNSTLVIETARPRE